MGRSLRGSAAAPGGTALERAILAYLVLFPAAHLVVVPMGGAMATGADLALVALLATGGVTAVRGTLPGPGREAAGAESVKTVRVGLVLLALFGVWAACSGLWGHHPRYAVLKGLAYVSLAGGAALLARSRSSWSRLTLAWLAGTGVTLLVLGVGLLGPEAFRERVLYEGGAVRGLPFPRVRGPFLHPSMFGEYLVVSAVLLWGVWPELGRRARAVAAALGASGAVALALTVSTAWLALGVSAVVIGRAAALASRPRLGLACTGGGVVIATVVLAGVLVPVDWGTGPGALHTAAIRPLIWESALGAVVAGPLLGVGAAPFLAAAPDPWEPATALLWDAHQAYLSVLGQFGVVGFVLIGAGVGWIVRSLRSAPPSRVRTATLAALAGVAAHALLVANEDFRHAWALLGLAGALATRSGEEPG